MVTIYDETDDDVVRTFRRVHANSEQTHVAIVSVGERDYAAIAYDIDPAEFHPIAAECVAYGPTVEGVNERAERWMDTHAKGIAPAQNGESGGSGMWSAVKRMAKKMNDYGNDMMDQQQQQQGGPK